MSLLWGARHPLQPREPTVMGAALRAPGVSTVGRADPQVGCALHEQCFTTPAETRIYGHAHTGLPPRPRNVAQSPMAASSPRPLIQTPIISAYSSPQTTSLLCFSFPALILPRAADSASPQLPSAGRGSTAAAREQHSHPRSAARHWDIPELPRRSLEADRAALSAATKGGEDCTSPNLPAELLLLGELFTSQGRAALQGKVHPRWECFAGEVIYSL